MLIANILKSSVGIEQSERVELFLANGIQRKALMAFPVSIGYIFDDLNSIGRNGNNFKTGVV